MWHVVLYLLFTHGKRRVRENGIFTGAFTGCSESLIFYRFFTRCSAWEFLPVVRHECSPKERMRQAAQEYIAYIDKLRGIDMETAVEEELAQISDEKLSKLVKEGPHEKYKAITSLYHRDPYLAELAKRRACWRCQLCGHKMDFNDKAGRPYLEAHHIIPLADGGMDVLSNLVG